MYDKKLIILFIIGFSLSFFIVSAGWHLVNEWYLQMMKSQGEDGFSNSITLVLREMNDDGQSTLEEEKQKFDLKKQEIKDILNRLKDYDVTTYVQGLYLPVGEASKYEYTNVIISYSGDWYRRLNTGKYPTKEAIKEGQKYAVISEGALIYTEDNGKIIKINGEEHIVAGVFDNYHSEYDMEICIFYSPEYSDNNIILQRLAESLMNGWEIQLVFGDDIIPVEEYAREFKNKLEEVYDTQIQLADYRENKEELTRYTQIKGFILTLMFLFSLINCTQITRLWIVKKHKELLILRTYGYGNSKLTLKFIKELSCIVGISLLLVIILDIMYFLIKDYGRDYLLAALRNSYILLVAFLLMVIIASVPISEKVKSISPAEGMREL